MTTTAEAVGAFFESYRMAFERLDPEIIAAHFAFPLHLASDAGDVTLTTVADKAEWTAQVTQLTQMYRAIGVWNVRLAELVTSEITERLVHARVRWELDDDAGKLLYGMEIHYTLAHFDGTLRIAAIAHDEVPRLRTAFARVRAARKG